MSIAVRSEYTPKKVAELIAEAGRAWEAAGHIPQGTMVHETQWLPFANLYSVAESLLDALTAVAAERDAEHKVERDRLHKAITEALEHIDHTIHVIDDEDGEPRMDDEADAYTEGASTAQHAIARILRAALDQEGNDDE